MSPVITSIPYAYCTDQAILGAKFYVMDLIPGQIFKDTSLRDLYDWADPMQVFGKAVHVLIELVN